MRRIARVVAPVAGVIVACGVFPGLAAAHVPFCEESVNPHGQNVPPAGTTLPGPKGGQNPDGFYVIGSNVGTEVTVVTGGVTFGPFPSGTVVKYTQAPGATPTEKSIGSTNGQAGAVFAHIIGPDDMTVVSIDGNTVSCLVPPPPK